MFVSSDRAPEAHVGGVFARSDRGRRAWRPGRAQVPGFDKGTLAGTLTGQCRQARSLPGGGEPTGPRPLSNSSGGSSGTVVTSAVRTHEHELCQISAAVVTREQVRSHLAHKTTLESAGIKLDSVVSDITGMSSTAMIEALIDGERRGEVLAGLARGRLRTAGKMADLSMALAGRFTDHHAMMCQLHRDRIKMFDDAVADLDARIAPLVARYAREAELLKTLPGFGDVVVAGWLGAIGPAPHQHFATAQRLASWATVCPGNYMSAKKSKGGRTGDGGNYIKPLLVQAAWAAVRVPGRLQARFRRLVRRFGGARNKGAVKRAIMAIAHTLLKIAYQVLKTGTPYTDLGAGFYASRETPQARQDYLIRQLQKLNPGCVITVTPAEAA